MNNVAYLSHRVKVASFYVSRQSKALALQELGVLFPLGTPKHKILTLVALMKHKWRTNVHDTPTCTCRWSGRLTQTLSAGCMQETSVLASRPAVAVLQRRQRGAGEAVGLGGAAAGQTGWMACWEMDGHRRQGSKSGRPCSKCVFGF